VAKQDEVKLICSFCGTSQHEVRKLIAGPSVYICDECIGLCNDIIGEEIDRGNDLQDALLIRAERHGQALARLEELSNRPLGHRLLIAARSPEAPDVVAGPGGSPLPARQLRAWPPNEDVWVQLQRARVGLSSLRSGLATLRDSPDSVSAHGAVLDRAVEEIERVAKLLDPWAGPDRPPLAGDVAVSPR